MSPFRPSRQPGGPDRWLHVKMALFVLGAALGIAGMTADNDTLVGVGIFVLAAGVLLRLLPERRE